MELEGNIDPTAPMTLQPSEGGQQLGQGGKRKKIKATRGGGGGFGAK